MENEPWLGSAEKGFARQFTDRENATEIRKRGGLASGRDWCHPEEETPVVETGTSLRSMETVILETGRSSPVPLVPLPRRRFVTQF